MPYEVLPHTADVGVAAWGASPAQMFAEAARGTAAILLDAEPPAGDSWAPVDVEAGDIAALLVSFLEECLYRYETRGELVVGARVAVSASRAVGDVAYCTGLEPGGTTIKAVTYHGLKVEERDGVWRGEAYFDV